GDDLLEGPLEVRADAVHLVDEADPRHAVLVGLAPHRLGLRLPTLPRTRYLSPWRHTVSACGSTPATESNTATAPSSTRSERSTSAVKSTWPGVSMMLIRWSSQKQGVAGDVIVMPRSCSWTIQSMVAVPSWTSPSL